MELAPKPNYHLGREKSNFDVGPPEIRIPHGKGREDRKDPSLFCGIGTAFYCPKRSPTLPPALFIYRTACTKQVEEFEEVGKVIIKPVDVEVEI